MELKWFFMFIICMTSVAAVGTVLEKQLALQERRIKVEAIKAIEGIECDSIKQILMDELFD